jgi:hypothetical protein
MSTPQPLGSHQLNETPERDIDQTIAALEGGVTTLNPDTGASIARTWMESLRQSDLPNLHHVADLLEQLEGGLRADRLDNRTIGDLMVRLGEGTRTAANEVDDARIMPRLDRLATVLTAAGRTLGASATEADTPGPAGA